MSALLHTFEALGDAVALAPAEAAWPTRLTWHTSTAWQALGLDAGALADELADTLAEARRDGRARRCPCGPDGALAVQVLPLPEGALLLRLHDERERAQLLQRQLDDRERLVFTSRSVVVGEMGSTLAHELNQPIGAAANLLRGLRLRLARREGADEELGAAERAIEQVMFASRVIARVREFAHARAPRLVPLDLAALMRASAQLLDWDLQRAGVTLALTLPEAPVRVLGDEVMLQQVLANLIRNAVDALRERPAGQHRDKPLIELSLRINGQQAEAGVADNGCGLGADAEQRLFVPFASTKPSGMGIGLAICRSFVELHQGRLWFSRRPEGGSLFHIGLPLAAPSSGERE